MQAGFYTMELTTPELTQNLLLAGAVISFSVTALGALWRLRAGIRNDLRAIVQDEMTPVIATQGDHSERLDSHQRRLNDSDRQISFLRERTAGLESAVFKRPPITEEDA